MSRESAFDVRISLVKGVRRVLGAECSYHMSRDLAREVFGERDVQPMVLMSEM